MAAMLKDSNVCLQSFRHKLCDFSQYVFASKRCLNAYHHHTATAVSKQLPYRIHAVLSACPSGKANHVADSIFFS